MDINIKRSDYKKNGFEDYARGMVSMQHYNCEQAVREFFQKELDEILKLLTVYNSRELHLVIAKHFDEMHKAVEVEKAKFFKQAV